MSVGNLQKKTDPKEYWGGKGGEKKEIRAFYSPELTISAH